MKYAVISGVFLLWGLSSIGVDPVVEKGQTHSIPSAQSVLNTYTPNMLTSEEFAKKFEEAGDREMFTGTCLAALHEKSVVSLTTLLELARDAVNSRIRHVTSFIDQESSIGQDSINNVTKNMKKKVPVVVGLLLGHDTNALHLLDLCCGKDSYSVKWS